MWEELLSSPIHLNPFFPPLLAADLFPRGRDALQAQNQTGAIRKEEEL